MNHFTSAESTAVEAVKAGTGTGDQGTGRRLPKRQGPGTGAAKGDPEQHLAAQFAGRVLAGSRRRPRVLASEGTAHPIQSPSCRRSALWGDAQGAPLANGPRHGNRNDHDWSSGKKPKKRPKTATIKTTGPLRERQPLTGTVMGVPGTLPSLVFNCPVTFPESHAWVPMPSVSRDRQRKAGGATVLAAP